MRSRFACALFLTSVVHAQPPGSDPTVDASILCGSLVSAYATSRTQERLALSVRAGDGTPTTSEVTWRFDPGPPMERSLRLELGPLWVYVKGDRLIAVHTEHPGTYAEVPLPGGLTGEALADVLPPLPFPQAVWALGPGGRGGTAEVLAMTQWVSTEKTEDSPCGMRLEGRAGGSPVFATISTQRPTLCAWQMPAALHSAFQISITTTALTPTEPFEWSIPVESRTRVASIADLKPLDPPVAVGQRVPTLGLMTAELVGWSLAEALDTQSDGPLNRPGGQAPVEHFAVLILTRTAAQRAAAAAEQARAAAVEVRADLDRRRHSGRTTLPRCFVRLVNVVELTDMTDPKGERARASANPVPTSEPSTVPLFAPGGQALLDTFVRGAGVVALVVDQGERLVAAIPIDTSAPFDAPAFTHLLRVAITGPHESTPDK